MADESPGGGGSHMERREMLIGNFKGNLPKRCQDIVVGRGLIFLPWLDNQDTRPFHTGVPR